MKSEVKVRHKMYKKRRLWLVAGIAVALLSYNPDGTQASSKINDTNNGKSTQAPISNNKTTKTVISSGVDGTVNWSLDDSGVLTFTASEKGSTFGPSTNAQWRTADVTKIVFSNKVSAYGSTLSQNFFNNMTNLKEIDGLANLDVSKVTSFVGFFQNDPTLTSLDLSGMDFSKGTLFKFMFSGDSSLTDLNLGAMSTSSATNMQGMFSEDSALTNIVFPSTFTTDKVTTFSSMFKDCANLKNLDLSGFDTSKATSFPSMFSGDTNLSNINLKSFDTSNVTNFAGMFQYCNSLTELDLSSFVINDSITDRSKANMLDSLSNLRKIVLGPDTNISGATLNEPSVPEYGNQWFLADDNGKPLGQDYYSSNGLMSFSASDDFIPGTYLLGQTQIGVHDSIIGVGDDWDPKDNLDSLTDAEGNPLDTANVDIDASDVDISKAGTYKVTYTYKDAEGNVIATSTATVTVIDLGHDSTIKQGSTWNASDNFNATNTLPDGSTIGLTDVETSGSVNTNVPGKYQITYTYTDAKGNKISKTITVTVEANGDSSTPSNPNGPSDPENPTNPSDPIAPNDPGVAQKGQVVYATNDIYMYKDATFKKGEREVFYARKGRINRSMFVVTGYVKSSNGRLRYKVRDVNHQSKTYGTTGYITALSSHVIPVYYQTHGDKYFTVISAKGVNAYDNTSLTGKYTHYKQGQQLRVVAVAQHNLTTRLKLSNGKYITANKKLVIAGKYATVTKVTAKSALNRYTAVNLTKRNKHFKRGTVLAVKGFDYSNYSNVSRHDTLRYKVSGGYVSGNSKLVSKVK